ncbi:MAG TPA: hypothetical protein DG048_14925 [Pseudoalteromonas sp.]|nr:hypothetical protein [Pseudoalteromonas sp.]|tara:strand:+ start:7534 stop:8619 length:1086 start_codon:yes stop_codon:yes gene_type:complete
MQEKSLKHSQAKESRKKAPRRRGFLKMFGFLGAGAVVGTASAPAQAGLFDSLLSIVKKILKAAVAGIALFYAWRFLMHSGEAIKGWLEKQIENDKKNNQDDVVVKAKFADFVNFGESVIQNAELMASYDTPDDGCDLVAMGTISSSLSKRKQKTTQKLSAEIGKISSLQSDQVLGPQIKKLKVDNIRSNASNILDNVDLLIGRRGFTEAERGQMVDFVQTLLGSIHDPEEALTKENMDSFSAKQVVRYSVSEILARRIKNDDIVDDFVNAQTTEGGKELARNLAVDGVSHTDVLNFNAQRWGLNPYNIFSIQMKPNSTPLYKKLLHVRAGGNALLNEHQELIKLRNRLVALQVAMQEKEGA